MKYGIWNVAKAEHNEIMAMEQAGFSPLVARILCSRGYTSPEQARDFLSAAEPLPDPLEMRDMDKAARRVRRALQEKETMAVFGDYDVDGITATCLLTEFLRSQGGRVIHYIPGRMDEGYGLNKPAIAMLKDRGVSLIITVDCGITANEEADYCRSLGVDLIITDHHECKDDLPNAVAVVDPHRKDHTYPHQNLAGVGVAFKLAAAVLGSQETILSRYSDLLCLGTVADVMPLTGENRTFVIRGLEALRHDPRPGIAALIEECGCDGTAMTATSIGYTLAPRINAAGRMGCVEVATELMLSQDPDRTRELAKQLCRLNRQRQEIEAEIYDQAVEMLGGKTQHNAIVLAGEDWHQGVVGIVASRLAEEYGCPAYLVCLDGEHGKASSRSYGGFNLFRSLEQLSHLLESYGGHELAAGFTIGRSQIDTFRREVTRLADEFVASGQQKAALELDCEVEPRMLTEENVVALDDLEPCGSGCPKPVCFLDGMLVDQLSEVGGGKHLRLRLSRDGMSFGAIFFSTTALRAGIGQGDRVEVAFTPQINEFRGMRSVQLNLVDIRPDRVSRDRHTKDRHLIEQFAARTDLSAREAEELLPTRADFAVLWRYLVSQESRHLRENLGCLSRKLSREASLDLRAGRLWVCLQVFQERGLLTLRTQRECVYITLADPIRKVDLEQSPIMISLRKQKVGD